MQGGGHGPASHDYGLGADQVLEASVVLADGSIVTASPCEHPDLFFAIRGGGGGTYGVVVSTTIKAWPNPEVVTQHLAISTLTADTSALFDAIAIVWAAYPDLNDAGYSGYGQWAVGFPVPLFANVTTGFVHGISMFGKSLKEAEAAFAPVAEKLERDNSTSLFVSVTYAAYPTYWDFYEQESGVEPLVGSTAALGSRLFDRAALTGNSTGLREMLEIIAGTPGQFTSNNFELVGGGQVFKDASDPFSGVNPAWRISYMNNIVARGLPPQGNASTITAIYDDITNTKTAAMKAHSPNTGAYMNEVCFRRQFLEWDMDLFSRTSCGSPATDVYSIGRPLRPRLYPEFLR
jgi:FAD/FMN-containing dehydrogenase